MNAPIAAVAPVAPVALVTGCNGKMGLAIARALERRGHQVVGVDVGENGLLPRYLRCDLADLAALRRMFDQVSAQYGLVRVLVNNAGVWNGKTFFDLTPDDYDRTFAVNARAPFFLCQEFARRLRDAGQPGAIVNLSSVVAKIGSAVVDYAGSKAALANFTRSLSKPLGAAGIRINAVAPGFINTAMTERVPAERRQQLTGACGLQRAGEADEVAAAVAFLASEEASYINGTLVEIDGGL